MRVAMLANAQNAHTRRWAEWLAAQDGVTVGLFTDTPSPILDPRIEQIRPKYNMLENVRVFGIGGDEYANNRHKNRVYVPALRAWKPDVVHAMEALGYGPVLSHAGEWPRVLTPWGSDVLAHARSNPAARELVTRAMQSADIISTNAPGLEEELSTFFSVPRDRFAFFSWGVDTRVFNRTARQNKSVVRARLGIPESARMLLSPRRPLESLGARDILQGWRRWKHEGGDPAAHLVLLRAGVDDTAWQDLLRMAANVPDLHLIEELLTPSAMAELFAAADAFISIPRTDLLAMSVLEGMVCGALPLLASLPAYRGSIADVADGGEGLTAIYRSEASDRGVVELLARWASTSPVVLDSLRQRNGAVVLRDHDGVRCAPRMLDVYRRARETFATRRKA